VLALLAARIAIGTNTAHAITEMQAITLLRVKVMLISGLLFLYPGWFPGREQSIDLNPWCQENRESLGQRDFACPPYNLCAFARIFGAMYRRAIFSSGKEEAHVSQHQNPAQFQTTSH
jgi:hypothetical protein